MHTFSEFKQQLLAPLHELGLREQEIDLYLHTALLGPSTVIVHADQLGLSAPNVYKMIARLEVAGLNAFS